MVRLVCNNDGRIRHASTAAAVVDQWCRHLRLLLSHGRGGWNHGVGVLYGVNMMLMEVAKLAGALRHTGWRWASPDTPGRTAADVPPPHGHGWFALSWGRIAMHYGVVIVYVMPDMWVAVAGDAVVLRWTYGGSHVDVVVKSVVVGRREMHFLNWNGLRLRVIRSAEPQIFVSSSLVYA
jgi:hypothetical protein